MTSAIEKSGTRSAAVSEKLGGDYIHFGEPDTSEAGRTPTLRAEGYMKLDPIKVS